MIPFSSFGTNSISWNSEEDLFSVQYENVTVKDILDYIEKHSKYIFIYSANVQKNLNNKVSISVSNKKIDAVLKELFSETGLNYKMSGRQITISVPEAPKVQQTAQQKGIKVTGNVSDEKGEPLIGVTIILKNDSTVHALTDMNGNYSIIVPERKSVLSFRYIGFVPKEEVVNNRKVVNVQMVEAERKFKIYVSALTTISLDDHNWIPTTDNRLLRRIIRDFNYRGYSARETISRWPSVRAGEDKWIFPYQENADVMFNSALLFEFAVLRLHAEPILMGVPRNCPEYCEAYRLLKFIKYFVPVQDKEIPPTSLLREFLGGSSFKY